MDVNEKVRSADRRIGLDLLPGVTRDLVHLADLHSCVVAVHMYSGIAYIETAS
jgi:hypothetical protein